MTDEGPQSHDLELDFPALLDLLNSAATRTIFWQVAELIDNVELTDEEIAAVKRMPAQYRQTVTASLLDYAETIREGSRNLDAQLMRLTGELV